MKIIHSYTIISIFIDAQLDLTLKFGHESAHKLEICLQDKLRIISKKILSFFIYLVFYERLTMGYPE